jgi:hypothetical protein
VGDALTNSYQGGGHRVLRLIFDAILGFVMDWWLWWRDPPLRGPFRAALETRATHKALIRTT